MKLHLLDLHSQLVNLDGLNQECSELSLELPFKSKCNIN